MPTSSPSGRRIASARRPLLAIFTAAFIVLQQVAFIFPAAAQVRRPAPDASDRVTRTTVTPAGSPAAKVKTQALDDPGPPNNSTAQTLPFSQAWTNNALITANDDWSGVPGIEGFLGQDITTSTGTDPQTLLGTSAVANDLDVIANQTNPNTFGTGGVAEFHSTLQAAPDNANPTIALNGSGTADAPYILIHLNTTGQSSINVSYSLRDLDCSVDNAQQQVALQYRVGGSGNFTNLPAGYVSDATARVNTTATDTANCTLVTPVSVALPAAADNQSLVQVRVITTNAAGNDEWVGVDDINVTGTAGGGVTLAINDVSQNEGSGGGTTTFTFTVSLSSSTHGGVTFDIATADGTAQDDNPATEDNDYTAKSLTGQTIANGSDSYQFTVDVNADSTVEPNETFFVNVTSVVGATVADGQGQGTIVNDDITLSFIHDVQGNGAASPIPGATVTVRGIVTLLKSNGFFLQEEVGDNDADPNTSEGIFVFTSASPTVAVGDQATVTGTVVEFNGLTEISASNANVSVNSTGNTLPTAVTLTVTDLPTNATPAQPQLEKYEGMRLSAASLTTVAPNDSFFDVPTVITGQPRPMREPGIPASDPVPPDPTSGTPDCCIPIWDENPERLLLDTNGRAGSTGQAITSNVVITNVAGPLDFSFGQYRLINESALSLSANMSAVPVPTPLASEFAVASYNIENFNNNATQRQKAALTIRDVLHLPAIIGTVEIFDLADLQALAAEVNTISPGVNYEARLEESDGGAGGDNDQDLGFLVDTNRVTITSTSREREESTYINPNTGNPDTLHDRPPFLLDATVDPTGANPQRVLVVVNHLRSFIDIELVAGDGPRVRAKRKAQAEELAGLLQELQTNSPGVPVISVGDYNAYQFSDGYTDPVKTIKGLETDDDEVVVDASPDLVNPDFFNLTDTLPADERYSFIFEGTPQALDHHIVNGAALARNTRSAIARVNADFPEAPAAAFASNAAIPERNSDHDPVVSYYSLGAAQGAGALIISEFRFHGPDQPEEASPETGGGGDTPGGPNAPGTPAENDEFIEFYNNTDADITVATLDGSAGWALVASDGQVRFIIPNGTVIPARHHFLAVNTDGYSLCPDPENCYGVPDPVLLPDGVTPAEGYDINILDESGIALFRTANPSNFTTDERLDAVGYASVPALYREGTGLTPGLEVGGAQDYSWVRQMCAFVQGIGCTTGGFPKDSGVNANDFVSVDTSGTTQSLGAPGPEGLSSPIQRNADFPSALLDTGRSAGAAPNRVRDLLDTGQNKEFGTMSIRRTFTNGTGGPVDYLSFRVVQITTFPQTPAEADLRVLDSVDIENVTLSNGTQVDVRGTYVEQPPTQPNGGALNSSLGVGYINLEGNTIEDGETVSVQFLLGVEKTGTFRFYINIEAFDECGCPAASEAQKGQPRVGVLKSAKPKPRFRRGRGRR